MSWFFTNKLNWRFWGKNRLLKKRKETVYISTGGTNGNLSVVCGTQLEGDSTLKISTTTLLPTTLLSSPTTAVLSLQPTSAITITNANIIKTTAAIVSEKGICGLKWF